jgi:hypothetical protein
VKIQIAALRVSLPEGKHEFAVQLAEPGVVRSVAWMPEQRLVMTRGEPDFGEILTLFVEFTPGAPMRTRRFLVLGGQPMNVPDGFELAFAGAAVSPRTGAVAHVYEVRELARPRGAA